MNSFPLVSIIVLMYKKFDVVEKNINSILMQDYPNIELILADDCSPNFDKNKIQSFIKNNKLKNVMIYSNNVNYGIVKNFNTAIKNSNGEYIVPLSADDYFLDKNFISNLVFFFQKNDCLAVTTKRKGSKSGNILPLSKDIELMKSDENIMNRLAYEGLYSGATLYYKRSIFDKIGFFDEKYILLEDYPYSIRMSLNGIRISFMDCISIEYGESGVTNGKISDILRNDLINNANYLLENKKEITNKRSLKYLYFSIDKLKKRKKILLYFKYFGIYFNFLRYKIKKKFFCYSDSFYWYYIVNR